MDDNYSPPIEMGTLGAEPNFETEEDTQEQVLELKKAIKVSGRIVTQLEYDFDSLTAKDLHNASKYLKKIGIPVSVPALDPDYQLTLFARAVKRVMPQVYLSDLMCMSAVDAGKAQALTRSFLLDMDPEQAEFGSDEQ